MGQPPDVQDFFRDDTATTSSNSNPTSLNHATTPPASTPSTDTNPALFEDPVQEQDRSEDAENVCERKDVLDEMSERGIGAYAVTQLLSVVSGGYSTVKSISGSNVDLTRQK